MSHFCNILSKLLCLDEHFTKLRSSEAKPCIGTKTSTISSVDVSKYYTIIDFNEVDIRIHLPEK